MNRDRFRCPNSGACPHEIMYHDDDGVCWFDGCDCSTVTIIDHADEIAWLQNDIERGR